VTSIYQYSLLETLAVTITVLR